MDDLTPVTRTERLLDGEDLTPTNREEMFIKRIYDKTQEIPEPVNRKEYFLKKAGEAGGDVTVVPLSVTENGTYTAPSGKAYTPVNVAVEGYALKALSEPSEVASFTAAELPLNKLKIAINAVQSGSGEPSPTNIRPISGWDAANVSDVDDVENPTVTQTTTISLGQTVYGGELDVVNGTSGNKLNREKIVFDGSSDENWSYSESWSKVNTSAFYLPPNSAIKFVSWDDYPFLICNILKPMSRNEIYDEDSTGIGLSGSLDGGSPTIRVPKTITNVNDLRTWLANNNIEAVYELATPTTFETQPTLIKSLNGQNNLSVDCGEILEGEYFKALGGE